MCWKAHKDICWLKKSKMPASMYIMLSFMKKEGMSYLFLCASHSFKLFTHTDSSYTSQLYQVYFPIKYMFLLYIEENWVPDQLRDLPVTQPVTGRDRIWLQAVVFHSPSS